MGICKDEFSYDPRTIIPSSDRPSPQRRYVFQVHQPSSASSGEPSYETSQIQEEEETADQTDVNHVSNELLEVAAQRRTNDRDATMDRNPFLS